MITFKNIFFWICWMIFSFSPIIYPAANFWSSFFFDLKIWWVRFSFIEKFIKSIFFMCICIFVIKTFIINNNIRLVFFWLWKAFYNNTIFFRSCTLLWTIFISFSWHIRRNSSFFFLTEKTTFYTKKGWLLIWSKKEIINLSSGIDVNFVIYHFSF